MALFVVLQRGLITISHEVCRRDGRKMREVGQSWQRVAPKIARLGIGEHDCNVLGHRLDRAKQKYTKVYSGQLLF